MRQPGCKPGRRSADFRIEGSKPSHGKGNRVLHPEPLSEKSGVWVPPRKRGQLRYIASADAQAIYATRLQLGEEAFRRAMAQQFFGDELKAA
jgi:hypothetical protein